MITRRALFGLVPAVVLAPVALLAKPSDGVALNSVQHPWLTSNRTWYIKQHADGDRVLFWRGRLADGRFTRTVRYKCTERMLPTMYSNDFRRIYGSVT